MGEFGGDIRQRPCGLTQVLKSYFDSHAENYTKGQEGTSRVAHWKTDPGDRCGGLDRGEGSGGGSRR